MDDELIDYTFDPDAEYSYFGNPYADTNPMGNEAWGDLINLDVSAYDTDPYNTGSWSTNSGWGLDIFSDVGDIISNTWDSITNIFTQSNQQSQAVTNTNEKAGISPLFILLGGYLLLSK